MRIGRNKTGAAGHIKKNTQGTSNEISFSVLDSMKGHDEDEDQESPLGRISLFTLGPKKPSSTPSKSPMLPGSSALSRKTARNASNTASKATWTSTDNEVKARRTQRKRSKRLAIGLIVALCVVGLVFLGIIGMGRYQQMQERAMNLTAQIEDVEQQYSVAEPFLRLVETTLATPLPDLDIANLETELSQWESRQQSITTKMRASKTSLEAIEEQVSGTERDRANDAIAAVNATIKAMEAGRSVLTEVVCAGKAYDQAEAFLDHAMKGDAAARDAVAGDLSDEGQAQAALEKSDEAIGEFAAARDAVQAVLSGAGDMINSSGAFDRSASELLQPFVDYANLRIQAQEYAKEADEGFLAVSSQRIAEANASYNQVEQQAAELISGLRDSYPTDIVQKAYEACLPQSENVASWEGEWTHAQQLLP